MKAMQPRPPRVDTWPGRAVTLKSASTPWAAELKASHVRPHEYSGPAARSPRNGWARMAGTAVACLPGQACDLP